jgi:hypothetical protein
MLSQAFKEGVKGDIQVRVTMYNVNFGKNRKLLNSCRPLSDYSLFTTDVRELTRQGYFMEEAVEIALKSLHEDSEVRKLIEENKAGVAKMILFEYDEKAVLESKERKAKEKVAKKLLELGVDLNIISQSTEIPIEKLKELK